MSRRSIAAAGAAFLLVAGVALPSPAWAGTTNNTFQATATVVTTATVSATSLAFGDYIGQQVDTTSAITVTATNGTSYTIGIDAGKNAVPATTNRLMSSPVANDVPQYLKYSLYKDSARTANWGTVGTSIVTSTGTATAQSFTVYGRIPAAQNAGSGQYTDTLTAIITY